MKLNSLVLFEDNHLLIVNKPAGLLVQADQIGDMSLLDYAKSYIKKQKNKPGNVFIGLPHRLDRPVSGVVILCKTSKALRRMTAIFRNRTILKQYTAIVHGRPDALEATLEDYIAQNKRGKKSFVSHREAKEAQRAQLRYTFLQCIGDYSMLNIVLETGRKHQIRVQLSHMGCPIVGDLKYGSHKRLGERICLHAHFISFTHPVRNEPISIEAAWPEKEEWDLFDRQ